MSTTAEPKNGPPTGIPELTALGRQLEMLRLDRGLSKQDLARRADTSRQQLWRVMTGKSELTTSLCQRLADVLGIDSRVLRNPDAMTAPIADAGTATLAGLGNGVAGELGRMSRGGRAARAGYAPTVAEYL